MEDNVNEKSKDLKEEEEIKIKKIKFDIEPTKHEKSDQNTEEDDEDYSPSNSADSNESLVDSSDISQDDDSESNLRTEYLVIIDILSTTPERIRETIKDLMAHGKLQRVERLFDSDPPYIWKINDPFEMGVFIGYFQKSLPEAKIYFIQTIGLITKGT